MSIEKPHAREVIFVRRRDCSAVIPAKAGIQSGEHWTPAFAGVTVPEAEQSPDVRA